MTAPRIPRDESGMTIVETMIAVSIMAVAFLGMAGVHAVAGRAQTFGRSQGLAANLVSSDLEVMRRTPLGAITSASSSATRSGVAFALVRNVTALGSSKRVEVTASWSDRFGPHRVRMATVVSGVTNP